MAITTTSLAADFSASSLKFAATSATGATVGEMAKVDNEYMLITAIAGTGISVAQRGYYGGACVAHDKLAPVQFGLKSDFPNPTNLQTIAEPVNADFLSVGENGVIPVPNRNTTYVITKGSALGVVHLRGSVGGAERARSDVPERDGLRACRHDGQRKDGTTGLHTTLTSPRLRGAGDGGGV